MKNKIIITLFLLTSLVSFSQKKITWEDLAKVEFVEKYYEKYGQSFLTPNFSDAVKDLEGKQVSITGYFLNLDPMGKIYILSKGPMSSCFFCGVGGPETAIELQFNDDTKFETDKIITVTGVLKLNEDDVEHFNYILTNCKAELAK